MDGFTFSMSTAAMNVVSMALGGILGAVAMRISGGGKRTFLESSSRPDRKMLESCANSWTKNDEQHKGFYKELHRLDLNRVETEQIVKRIFERLDSIDKNVEKMKGGV